MHFSFIDDTHFKKDNADLELYGSIIVHEQDYPKLVRAVNSVKVSYGLGKCDPVKFSPPNNEIYRKQRSVQNANELKKAILRAVAPYISKIIFSMISTNETVIRSLDGITKKQINSKLDSTRYDAIKHLNQRFQFILEEEGGDSMGLVVLEKMGGTKQENMTNFLSRYHEHVMDGSVQWGFTSSFNRLFDFVSYAHDAYCVGIQVADLVTSSFKWSIENGDYSSYLNLYKDKIRKSPQGEVSGYGVVFYPKEMRYNFEDITKSI